MHTLFLSKTLLVFALYIEAQPFIEALKIKKREDISSFQLFENEDYAAVITGSGKIMSAIGSSILCERYSQEAKAIWNIGIAGNTKHQKGDIFQISKITDTNTGREYYPDILQKFFPLFPLTTVSSPETEQTYADCVDMEGSGFYEAASCYFSADKIFCIKVVSDDASEKILPKKDVKNLMKNSSQHIIPCFEKPHEKQIFQKFTDTEEKEMQKYCEEKKLTHSRSIQYRKKKWNEKVKKM